jgi:hypothetical protein
VMLLIFDHYSSLEELYSAVTSLPRVQKQSRAFITCGKVIRLHLLIVIYYGTKNFLVFLSS